MNKHEAQNLVKNELERSKEKCNSTDCLVLEEETIEKPWGWVFFYQSKEYVETGNFREMIGGNAPIIVNRNTGDLIYTGTANNIEFYVKEYEATLQANT